MSNVDKGGFSDDEDDTELRGGKCTPVARKTSQSSVSTRGRGGRTNASKGRGKGSGGGLKQTTLDMSASSVRSQR
jgi:hypothetical protein